MKNQISIVIITAILSSAIGIGGFYGGRYYEKEDKKSQYRVKKYEELYDLSFKTMNEVRTSFYNISTLMSKKYGLTKTELEKPIKKITNSMQNYEKLVDELRRYGTTNQIEIAKNIQEWLFGMYRELGIQYEFVEGIEKDILDFIYLKEIKSKFAKDKAKYINEKIENIVKNENRIYFKITEYEIKVVNALEQSLYFQFRKELGLKPTLDMLKTLSSLPKVAKESNDFKYKEKPVPFFFASNRVMNDPNLKYELGDLNNPMNFMKIQEDEIKGMIFKKFFESTWINNPSLRKKFEEKVVK